MHSLIKRAMTPQEVSRRLRNVDWVLRGYFVVGTVGVVVLVIAVVLGLSGAAPPDFAVVWFAAGLSGPLLSIAYWRGRRRLRRLRYEVEADPKRAEVLMSQWVDLASFRSWVVFGVVVGALLAVATILFVTALPGR